MSCNPVIPATATTLNDLTVYELTARSSPALILLSLFPPGSSLSARLDYPSPPSSYYPLPL